MAPAPFVVVSSAVGDGNNEGLENGVKFPIPRVALVKLKVPVLDSLKVEVMQDLLQFSGCPQVEAELIHDEVSSHPSAENVESTFVSPMIPEPERSPIWT